MSFWGELKRRNVYKVGVAYAIVAWLLIQAAAIIFPHLNLPSWAVTLVIVILIIGFPLALIFAWAFEITPQGLKLTKEVPLHESITHLTGKKLNYILAGLLILSICYIVIDKYFIIDRETVETEQAPSIVDTEKAKKTIAVLPFVDISPDKDQEYFVDGLSEELINCLAQLPDLTVIARTSSFTFKGSDKKIQEIAIELGVENILEGSVRKAGNALRITAQLVKAVDGSHLWSKTYNRELRDIFAVQEDIATAVANELKVTLGIGESLKQLGGTENLEAYELYLSAKGQTSTTDPDVHSRTLELLDAAIALDSEFALAWAAKAHFHSALVIFGSADRAAEELDEALSAALKAIEIEPQLGTGYLLFGWLNTIKSQWIDAESAYRKALELPVELLSGSESSMVVHYQAVGHFKKADELLEEMRQNDPINQRIRAHYILNLAFLGNIQQAEDEYDRGMALFGGQWPLGDTLITYIRQGYSDFGYRDIVYSSKIYDSVKDYLDSPKEGLAELHRIYTNSDNLSLLDFGEISIWAAFFGDPEFAMDTWMKASGLQCMGSGTFYLWLPVMKEVRQMPKYRKFLKDIGLVDYWEKFGWPDICHQLDNGDFECD